MESTIRSPYLKYLTKLSKYQPRREIPVFNPLPRSFKSTTTTNDRATYSSTWKSSSVALTALQEKVLSLCKYLNPPFCHRFNSHVGPQSSKSHSTTYPLLTVSSCTYSRTSASVITPPTPVQTTNDRLVPLLCAVKRIRLQSPVFVPFYSLLPITDKGYRIGHSHSWSKETMKREHRTARFSSTNDIERHGLDQSQLGVLDVRRWSGTVNVIGQLHLILEDNKEINSSLWLGTCPVLKPSAHGFNAVCGRCGAIMRRSNIFDIHGEYCSWIKTTEAVHRPPDRI